MTVLIQQPSCLIALWRKLYIDLYCAQLSQVVLTLPPVCTEWCRLPFSLTHPPGSREGQEEEKQEEQTSKALTGGWRLFILMLLWWSLTNYHEITTLLGTSGGYLGTIPGGLYQQGVNIVKSGDAQLWHLQTCWGGNLHMAVDCRSLF